MQSKFESLTVEQLTHLLSQERRKFIVAIDYGASCSDLQEIRDSIKELEAAVAARNNPSRNNSESRSSVA